MAISRLGLVRILALLAVAGCGGSNTAGDAGMGDLNLIFEDMTAPPGPPTKCTISTTPRKISDLGGKHEFPRLAYDGTHFVVAFTTDLGGGPWRADVQFLDALGASVGPNIALADAPMAAIVDFPSVASIATGTLIAWTSNTSNIMVTTFDKNRQKLARNGLPCGATDGGLNCGNVQVTTSGAASAPFFGRPKVIDGRAAMTETEVGLAWIDYRNHVCTPGPPCNSYNDVYWKKIKADGTEVIAEKRLTVGTSKSYGAPRMAHDGQNEGLAWREGQTTYDFSFSTIDAQGATVSPPTKVGSGSFSSPDLVWDGSNYALTTTSGTGLGGSIVYRRFSNTGTSIIGQKSVSSSGGKACTPSIASDGKYYAIAWQTDCGQQGSDLVFTVVNDQGERMAADGTVCPPLTDPTCGIVRLTNNTGTTVVASYPEIVWEGGHGYGLTWMEVADIAGGARGAEIMFSRVECTSP